jgi:hypothetical protein
VEARAVRVMVSAVGRPELIRVQSSLLLLLSALNLWAEVVDWLTQGACREVARAHFRDCLDVLSLYPGDAGTGVAVAYDRCRRDAAGHQTVGVFLWDPAMMQHLGRRLWLRHRHPLRAGLGPRWNRRNRGSASAFSRRRCTWELRPLIRCRGSIGAPGVTARRRRSAALRSLTSRATGLTRRGAQNHRAGLHTGA